MLNAINTKILLAILAALTVIGGAVIYQRDQATKTAFAAAKAAEILQLEEDDNDYLKHENEALRKQVEADKKWHSQQQPMKARPGRPISPNPRLKSRESTRHVFHCVVSPSPSERKFRR